MNVTNVEGLPLILKSLDYTRKENVRLQSLIETTKKLLGYMPQVPSVLDDLAELEKDL